MRFNFLVLLVTRPRPLLGQVLVETLNLETCNVYLPKAFQTLIHENVADIVFFIVYKNNIYSFGFIEALDSKQRTCQNVQGLCHQSGK